MKNCSVKIIKFFSVLVFLAAEIHGGAAYCANTAAVTASASIVSPIAVERVSDLAFGSIVQGQSGTVVISPGGDRASTGLDVVASSGKGAASFNVSGQTHSTFSVQLPDSIQITANGNSMNVDSFTTNLSGNTGVISGDTARVDVGATLHVNEGQSLGDYTGSFTITVCYN